MSGKKIGVGFLQRHLRADVSKGQMIFDIVFGILAPIVCFIIDPGVFQRTALGGLLVDYYLFAYLGAGIGIITLIFQLSWGKRLRMGGGIMAGVLLAGALVALLIGLLILPTSLLGILAYGIGLLGFIPFLTSFVFFRNGLRALRQAKTNIAKSSLILSITLGIIIAIGIPSIANWGSSRFVAQSIDAILHGDTQQAEASIQRLKHAFWCNVSCFDDIVDYYHGIIFVDNSARDQFTEAYMEITGDDIKDRRRELYPWSY